MSKTEFDSAETFPAATRAAWEALAREALKKAGALRTPGGLSSRGLYAREDPPGGRAAPVGSSPAVIGAKITAADPAEANRQAKEEIAGGAGALFFVLDEAFRRADLSLPAGEAGIALRSVQDLARLLEGVDESSICLFAAGAGGVPLAQMLGELQRTSRPAWEKSLHGSAGADPLGALAEFGAHPGPWDAAVEEAAELAAHIDGHVPGLRIFVTGSLPYHLAGASPAQELAAALSAGVTYLRALADAGLSLSRAAHHIGFETATDADFFGSIAKLRALRRIWARVLEASGDGDAIAAMRIAATTSPRMMGRRDAHTNLLRTTIAAAAAIIGGADVVGVLPFTERAGTSALARRLARNIPLLLKEESDLARVLDAAGGSFALEAMTEELALGAWEAFQEIEREGGLAASLQKGALQRRIGASAEARKERLAKGELTLVGVTSFAPPKDVALELDPAPPLEPRPPQHQALAELAGRSAMRTEPLPKRFDEDLAGKARR